MSQAIAERSEWGEQDPQPFGAELDSLVRWANSARAAHAIAKALAVTPFVPDSIKLDERKNLKPVDVIASIVTGAILAGHEVGLQPMAALRSIDIIKGTPAMRAVAMRGLVQSHGHSIRVVEQTDAKAVVVGRRKDETEEHRSTWTMERARRLGLATKDQWQKQPEAMLVARATAECCRLTASDVLLGIPYSTEEMEDVPDADEIPAPRRTAKRKPVGRAPVAEPQLAEPVADDDVDPLADVVVPFAQPEPDLEP
jgi:hypothetical protein